MKIYGIEVKASAEQLLSYYEIRAAVDWIIAHYNLDKSVFDGLTIRALASNQKTAACYQGHKKTVTLYVNHFNFYTKVYRKAVLVHELTHALQRGMYGDYSVLSDSFLSVTPRGRVKNAAYFSQPIEMEAFATQYAYLVGQELEVLMKYFVDIYAQLNINLPKLASHTTLAGKE